jgi:trehalose 6-phosphate phosphatase
MLRACACESASKRAFNIFRRSEVRHLFSPAGEQALEAVMRQRPLLAFDFDGTLAPIVARHNDARVSKSVARWLQQLSEVNPIAIVTGRSVADVVPRLGFKPQYIIGNHGAEDPSGRLPKSSTQALDALRQRLAVHAKELRDAGVQIEDKKFSLALHYRLARDRERAGACIADVLGNLDAGLKTFGGKCVVNIAPVDAPDKGDAVASLARLAQAPSVVFVGDDLNDEAVFLKAEDNWLTVRIGRDAPGSAARFFLDSHSEVATLLQAMLAHMRAP